MMTSSIKQFEYKIKTSHLEYIEEQKMISILKRGVSGAKIYLLTEPGSDSSILIILTVFELPMFNLMLPNLLKPYTNTAFLEAKDLGFLLVYEYKFLFLIPKDEKALLNDLQGEFYPSIISITTKKLSDESFLSVSTLRNNEYEVDLTITTLIKKYTGFFIKIDNKSH
jgi:hypothetical protein